MIRIRVTILCLFLLTATFAYAGSKRPLILATTTSTQDSGLLDHLVPLFEQESGYPVKTIAVGSGQAMALGRRGEADVLLVHAPAAERDFVANGFGISRQLVMYNDFVLVGPSHDPAHLAGLTSAPMAFSRLASAGALFLSRGDDSGTHQLEKRLWSVAGSRPEGRSWYQQTGLGMGQTLAVAAEKRGYTLTDRGTFLALQKSIGLVVMVEKDPLLLNPYHVIEVNPSRWQRVNADGARAFAGFLVAEKTQRLIGAFGLARFGTPLFTPAAGKTLPGGDQ